MFSQKDGPLVYQLYHQIPSSCDGLFHTITVFTIGCVGSLHNLYRRNYARIEQDQKQEGLALRLQLLV
jgi:hypothetical protein